MTLLLPTRYTWRRYEYRTASSPPSLHSINDKTFHAELWVLAITSNVHCPKSIFSKHLKRKQLPERPSGEKGQRVHQTCCTVNR